MERVFVFSNYFSHGFPSIDELTPHLPAGAIIVWSNLESNDAIHPYFMIQFEEHNATYHEWCAKKDADVYIFLELTDQWKLYS
jgi:hypothetical protein